MAKAKNKKQQQGQAHQVCVGTLHRYSMTYLVIGQYQTIITWTMTRLMRGVQATTQNTIIVVVQ